MQRSMIAVGLRIGLISALLCAAVLSVSQAAVDLYVAQNGNDRWSGRQAEVSADGSDGPLLTLHAARDAIRQMRRGRTAPAGPVTVHIRGGVYELPEPFVLDPEDSGTADSPVVYQAYGGEQVVISGGRLIRGFRQNGPVWQLTLPDVSRGRWYFRQLFVDGQRRSRARAPNEGYFRIAALLPGPKDAQGKAIARDKFRFAPADLKPWANLQDVNLILMHSWETSIHPLKSVDQASNIVEFAAPLKEWWSIGYWEQAQRYYVENARELLDQPGEWYLERNTGLLTYWPMPGEQIDKVQVVAPRLTQLVRLAGNPDDGRFVQYITFRNLTFHYCDWELDPRGNSSTQAAVEVPAAIMADGALHCTVEDCQIAHLGSYGVWLRNGCKQCIIRRCSLFDLGAGGIRIGQVSMPDSDRAESSHNLVDNNHIYDGGQVAPAGVGVWVAQSSHNIISHNDIHDLLYSGISVGWNWDDSPNRCHHNRVEFNHIHHLVKGVLSDAGAIYTLGVSTGSVIRNNLCHDIWPYHTPPFGWGIYLDATCSGYLVENNIVFNTMSGGLMYNNGGHEHVIRNNIFALSANYQLWPYWEKRPSTFERNIIHLTQGQLFVPSARRSLQDRLAAGESLGSWDYNVYWHTAERENLRFFGESFQAWRSMGLDQHSLIADPMFRDAAAGDFRLREDSPALKMGFAPIDPSKAGLYGNPEWVNQARSRSWPRTELPPASSP